jgi:Peptidase propeptide and YPEB domain
MEMKKAMTLIGGVVLAILFAIGGAFAQKANYTGSIQIKSDDEAVYGDMAKISLDSAVSAALKAVPGKVLKVELENENGFLVYGVEIAKADHQLADVKVDAGNGKVLKIDAEQNNHEGHEGEDSDNGHEEVNER